LKDNNIHYKDIAVPELTELPMPIIIDNSENDDSEDYNIEATHDTTVFFPEIGDIQESRGDCQSKEQLLQHVLSSGKSNRVTIVSKPTKYLVPTWKAEDFVKSFPRQFPFGLGCKPDNISTNDYTKHLMTLSNNGFQRADFILVIANIHFKDTVVRNAGIRCKFNCGKVTARDRFNDIDADEINSALKDPTIPEDSPNSHLSYFVLSVFAISKHLPFTDVAVKEERNKLFSLSTKFGLPTGLLTVTPEDSDNFKMYLYKMEDVDFVSLMQSNNCDSIKNYLTCCEEIRLNYPGVRRI